MFVIIFAEVWKTTPFIALLLLGGLALVPDDLYKAAKMDGATSWQRFIKITLPLIRPALMVAVLFRTLDAFRIYDAVFIITRGANNTETVSILGYNQLVNRLNLGPRIGRRDPDLHLRDADRVHLLPLPRREPGTEVTDHDRVNPQRRRSSGSSAPSSSCSTR